MWRNWQTRMIQVHVGRPVQVQVLLSALKIPEDDSGFFCCFRNAMHVYTGCRMNRQTHAAENFDRIRQKTLTWIGGGTVFTNNTPVNILRQV